MTSLISAALAMLIGGSTLAIAEEPGSEVAAPSSPLASLWQDWRGAGVWRSDYFHSSKSLDDESGFLGTTAQLELFPTVTDLAEGKIDFRVTNPATGAGGETKARLLEGYATVHFERADLHIGKQIVAWGRADGINPTDNISPRDFTVLLPFEDDQRVGTTALKLDWYLSQEHTLTILAAPWFEPSTIPLPSSLNISRRTPPHTLSNTQAALKLNKVGESSDWSVSYFRGLNLLPTARGRPAGLPLELHYDRISVLGADFARNIGRFGVRGEVAYVDSTDRSNDHSAVKEAYLFWIVGVDRTFREYLNLNVQFFERRARGYRNPATITDPGVRSAAQLNAIIDGLPERTSHGISFRVSHQWSNETLEAEVFAAINLTHSNHVVRPLVTYAFNDRWKGTIGAEFYGGGADTQYGSLKANRGAFVELRYGF